MDDSRHTPRISLAEASLSEMMAELQVRESKYGRSERSKSRDMRRSLEDSSSEDVEDQSTDDDQSGSDYADPYHSDEHDRHVAAANDAERRTEAIGTFGGGESDERRNGEWNGGSSDGLVSSVTQKTWHDYQPENKLPVDMNMSTGSPNADATHVAREDCPHLADPEWEALQRLSTVIGEAAVATMLRTLSPTEQHGVAQRGGFIMKKQREIAARATVSTPSTPRVDSLKLHVNSYVGREGEPLLRWLVEVDTAITARRIVDPLSKVAFAMSCLGGRARSWAYGRRLTDPTCFSTYEIFKEETRQAFEPPQNGFRSRVEFLDLQQGKRGVHAYAQRAWYLVSNIVTNPIDEATKVVTFMKRLKDGPVKTYLFREYPSTFEAAITLAMQEAFSLCQANLHANAPRPMLRPEVKPTGDPEPMDPSTETAAGPQQRRGSTNVRCFRCAGPPAGDAVERVDIGHAVSKAAAPRERHSHYKKKDGKPNLVILKVNSKRESSLRALVDCGASNNFVRLQSLARLDFEEVELPRSLLEVRLATGVVVRTEKRVVRPRFSYEEKKFVDELIVLDLDDKFDMVLGMPWLARHDL
ncbi:unnamed protein product [Phytophthora fragariaefolia]|uniref:Unnamed protein product n=1 Tax=Phytophthora fragariaefolia TaxID=1490495 RepID=A0A9W6Y9B4_9STRA|nr:unnamed protein product [Phytophthora fragariaefolia]